MAISDSTASVTSSQDIAVVVFPFVAHSHLNLLLDLSLRLSDLGLTVYYATSGAHIRQVKSRGLPSGAVRFHELPLPPFPVLAPNPNSSTKFPIHVLPVLEPFAAMQAPLASLLRDLSAAHSRLVVIHDQLGAFAAVEASRLPNAVSYAFCCVPAAYMLAVELGAEKESVLKAHGLTGVPPSEGGLREKLSSFVALQLSNIVHVSGMLVNSCRALEGDFLDSLALLPRYSGKKLFSVAPLRLPRPEQNSPKQHQCLDWLDEQPVGSVLYVSFGTTTTLPEEQIEQLAAGLRRSGQRFIWVLRAADRAVDSDEYDNEEGARKTSPPLGYEKDADGTSALGMILRGWAPQREILAHAATGAFMTHCGWNSCLESLGAGVPLLAWPMHSDQPLIAALVTQRLKAGVMVVQGARPEEVVPAAVIEEAITRAMVSDEGKKLRRRAKEWSEAIREAASEDGSSHAELDAFVAHITATSN